MKKYIRHIRYISHIRHIRYMRHIVCILAAVVAALCLAGARAEISSMLHRGHPVDGYAISYDESYIFTRGDAEICVWDLRNRMLITTLPVKTSRIEAHPTDPHLIYVKLRDVGMSSSMSDADYAIIDWTDGSTVGYVSARRVPSVSAKPDLTVCTYNDDMLVLVPMTMNAKVAGYIGGLNADIGSARTNHNDSLLLTSGLFPQVWDLRHAALACNVPYYRYLRPEGKGSFAELRRIPYARGQRPSTATFCEAYFMPGSDDIILGGVRDTVTVWRPGGGIHAELVSRIPVGAGPSPSLSVSGDTIIAATKHGIFRSVGGAPFRELEAFRLASGRDEFNTVSRPYGAGRFLAGSSDGRKGMASVIEGAFGSDTPLRVADKAYGWVQDIKLSPRADYAAVTYGNRGIARLDLTGDTLRYGPALETDWLDGEKITRCEVLPDGTVVGGTTLGALSFWKKGTTRSFMQNRVHHASINSITLSNDSTRMFTADRAGQITIWDTATLKPVVYLYQVLGLDDPGYVLLTPDHYYKATPNAREFMNFVKDGRPYAFEQFDLRNNRPDIVLSRLGGDPAEIDLLHHAWQKRLRRAGIKEESLSTDYHVPEATVTNRDRIPAVTADSVVTIEAIFSDAKYDLGEISVTLNGVPVLDPALRRVSGRRHSMTLPLELASGNNSIVVTCTNSRGAGSLRETINVTCTPRAPRQPDLYVVAVGVGGYADARYNLDYAAKDASDFAAMMQGAPARRFGAVHPLVLTDSDFSAGSLDSIRRFLSGARRDDVVIIFYAGHGVLDANLDYYLATHGMDFANPAQGGIPYDDFVGVLDGTAPVNRYCFIDACHSGELDKDDYLAVNTVAMPEGEELVFRAAGPGVAAKEDVERVNALLGDMFLDLRWGVGATVLSSAGGAELAVEGAEWKNGLFTYCLKKGLENDSADADHNGTVTLKEWIDYTSRQVTELSGGRQSPTLRAHNYHNDLNIK